jgi:hypothetical protein
MMKIDISKMNKCEVVAKLFNNSKPIGMGFFQDYEPPMTNSEAEKVLDQVGDGYIDYCRGRVMKVDVSGNTLDPRLYDRDNGQGAALRALTNHKEGNEI